MNEFMVSWGDDKSLELRTREAAVLLKKSFLEEGQTARAFQRITPASEWVEIV